MNLFSRIPARAGAVLFCFAALYFVARGPWRAITSVNSYDFASVYGATRCWLRGENPFDMRLVRLELRSAGDNPATLPNTDPPPSVYLPTAFPIISSVAWLPWKAARVAWSLLSVAVFGFSIALSFGKTDVTGEQKWLLWAGVLLFSPTSSGLATGNPSVIACGLTLAAICVALPDRISVSRVPQRQRVTAALLLGLAHSIKPQISIAAVAALLLWGCWRTVMVSFLTPAAAAMVSLLRAAHIEQYRLWLMTLRNEIATASLPGGLNDPSPANYFSYHLVNAAAILAVWLHDPRIVTGLVGALATVLIGAYLWLRKNASGDRRLRDLAFFCALPLMLVYHRYYDAQLLLGIIPFLFTPAAMLEKAARAVWIGLLVLLFPLQAILAESFPHLNPASPAGFLLLRNQPLDVLLICVLLIPWPSSIRV